MVGKVEKQQGRPQPREDWKRKVVGDDGVRLTSSGLQLEPELQQPLSTDATSFFKHKCFSSCSRFLLLISFVQKDLAPAPTAKSTAGSFSS